MHIECDVRISQIAIYMCREITARLSQNYVLNWQSHVAISNVLEHR